jgi:voltage-gated potassium channel
MSRSELPRLQYELTRKPLTPGRAARIIVVATALVTIAGGVLIWLVDHREFPDLGTSLWWSLQTVTTVGYGDVVPEQTGGRIIGAVVMLQGIGLITVIAAAVTATLIDQLRRRRGLPEDPEMVARLERIDARLTAIERGMGPPRD